MKHVLEIGEVGMFENIYGNATEVERIDENRYYCFDVDMQEEIAVEFVDFKNRIDD